MNRSSFFRFVPFAILCLAVFASCSTTKFEVTENMTQAEYFQRAQEAADENNWDVAIAYYEAFLQKFPEDLPNVAAAEYEIAFLHMKKGNNAEAETRFKALLARYETDFNGTAPEWPKVLSEKMLENLAGSGQ